MAQPRKSRQWPDASAKQCAQTERAPTSWDDAVPAEARLTADPHPKHAPRRYASSLLACRDMRTLYLRNVPDEVVERLARLAARDATSVGAVAVRELTDVSRRADNPALLGALPDVRVDVTTLVSDIDAERAGR